jgi:hypothetical protein
MLLCFRSKEVIGSGEREAMAESYGMLLLPFVDLSRETDRIVQC